jgi:voltage-gated potassium channel
MSTVAYAMGAFLQMVTAGEIRRLIGDRRMSKHINQLTSHVIVCGYGRTGEELCEHLQRHKVSFLVIDASDEGYGNAVAKNILCIKGDATEDDVLDVAGIDVAKTLITTLPSDASNVFITLTARTRNATLQIISRADHPTSANKLRQAGVNRVILPTSIGAQKMARMVTRPVAADLIDLVVEQTFVGVELDELKVNDQCRLVGVSVRQTDASRKHHLLVVGVKRADGQMVFNPTRTTNSTSTIRLWSWGRRKTSRNLPANTAFNSCGQVICR